MRPSLEMSFKGVVDGQKHTDGRTIYRGVATTPALDRYGEVVLPKGAIISNFLKNPVLLELHNYQKSSVGRVTNIEVREGEMLFDFVFSSDERGQELEAKYKAGDMSAFSIGFRPKATIELWNPWGDEPEVTEVKAMLPDGSEQVVDISKYEHVPYRIYNKWELLEISPVSVPANPEALLMREAEDIVRRAMDTNPVAKTFVQAEIEETLAPALKLLEEFHARFGDGEFKMEGAVPNHKTPIQEGEWSGSAARASLAKWASKDGSGDKEKMNWSKYSKGFAWFDSAKADSFGSYKLPHHIIADGSLVAVWRGVTSAMSALLGARGGVDLDSKDAVYSHLAKHYKDYGKEPPAKKEYTAEELKAIEDEPLEVPEETPEVPLEEALQTSAKPEEGTEGTQTEPITVTKLYELNTKILVAVERLIEGMTKMDDTVSDQLDSLVTMSIKMTLLSDMLEETSKAGAPKVEEREVETPEEVEEEEAVTVARSLIEDLETFVKRPGIKRHN